MARKMKDSGIEWIGEIPEGWEITRLKYLADFEPTCDTSYLTDESKITYTPMECVKNGGFENRSALYGNLSHTLTPFQNGDIAMAKVTPCFENGNIAIMDNLFSGFGLGSSELFIFRPKSISTRYFFYWLQNKAFVARACSTMTGTGGLKRISPSFIRNCPVHCPSTDEQTKISDYLDAKCSEIDDLLTSVRSSIEEYKKLKQAVITRAVTKGVRGEREIKDSGVEWIGEIPKEWRKTQLRHCATIKSGITLGKSYSKDTILIERPYLRVANVQGGYVDLNDLATIEVTPDEDLKYRLHSGDVLMTEGGDRDKLGRGCVWHGEIEPCLHQNHVFAVQTNDAVLLPEFLEYLTASDVGRSYFDITAIKTTNLACTSSSKVLAFTIPLPSIEEQIEIVAFIKKRSLELNKLIIKKELLVQELESYKKSLIYEVVTGKREV